MSKNACIQYPTSKLVWIIQRPKHPEHADARAEAVRRCTKPAGSIKAKNVAALEAALLAADLGQPVPARSTTLKRTMPVYAERREFAPNAVTEAALDAGASWAPDGAIVPA